MSNFNLKEIQNLIINIRNKEILIDRDIARLYGVETKRINEVVKNNINKFPTDYLFQLSNKEFNILRSLQTTTNLEKVRVLPKAFTEKGLYMLATLLRSKKANEVTFQIIETFSKIKELSKNINQLSNIKNENNKQELMGKSSKIITELFENDLKQTNSETSIELNFAVLKFKHSIKKN